MSATIEETREALYGLSAEINPVHRATHEAYINAMLKDKEHVFHNVGIFLDLLSDTRLSKIILTLLQKMLKILDVGNMKIASNFIAEYSMFVLGMSSAAVMDIYRTFAGQFAEALAKGDVLVSCFYLSNFIAFVKQLLELNRRARKMFADAQQMYKDTFDKLLHILSNIDAQKIINTENVAFLGCCFRSLQYLTLFYERGDLVVGSYWSIFKPLLSRLVAGETLGSLELGLLTQLHRVYRKCYFVLIQNSEFFKDMCLTFFKIFLWPEQYAAFGKDPVSAQIGFKCLSLFVATIESFIIYKDFPDARPDGLAAARLDELIGDRIGHFPQIITAFYEVFCRPTIAALLAAPDIGIKTYIENKSRNFSDDPFKGGLKFARVLYELYWEKDEETIKKFTSSLLNNFAKRMIGNTNFLRDIDFYYQLQFIEDNISRLIDFCDLQFIFKRISQLQVQQLNYFLLKFCKSYFAEKRVADLRSLDAGLEFSYRIMDGGAGDLANYIAVNIAILILAKADNFQIAMLKVDMRKVLEYFHYLLMRAERAVNEELDLLILLDLWEKIANAVASRPEHIYDLLHFLVVLSQNMEPTGLNSILPRVAETFADLVLDLPNNFVTNDFCQETICLLEAIVSAENPCDLKAFTRLIIFFLFRFEIFCDSFFTNPKLLRQATVFHPFLNFVRYVLYPKLDVLVAEQLFNEIVLLLRALVSCNSKLYVLLNFKALKPTIISCGGIYSVDIELPCKINNFSVTPANKSLVKVVLQNNLHYIESIGELKYEVAQVAFQFAESQNAKFYKRCIDVLEFMLIRFPFLTESITEVVFESFDMLDFSGDTYAAEERAEILLLIGRLMAQVIFFYPNFLLANQNRSLMQLIEFLKRVKTTNEDRGCLLLGVLSRECVELLLKNYNSNFIAAFEQMNVGGAEQRSPRESILALFKLLTHVIECCNAEAEYVDFSDDSIWETSDEIIHEESWFAKFVS